MSLSHAKEFISHRDDFRNVLKSIETDRQTLSSFSCLASRHSAYAPLALFLKPVGHLCYKESLRLEKRIKTLDEICMMYDSICEVLQKPELNQQEKAVTIALVKVLISRLQENAEQMRSWHLTLKNYLMKMDTAVNIAHGILGALHD